MNIRDLIDSDRYPLHDPQSPRTRELITDGARAMKSSSLFLLPGFVSRAGIGRLLEEVESLVAKPRQYRREPYSFMPIDESLPKSHPTRRAQDYELSMLYAEQFSATSHLRSVYEWPALLDFAQAVVGRTLYCSADPTYSLMTTFISDGGQHGWHFDTNEFVVSLMLRPAAHGGIFEYVPDLRTQSEENFDEVGKVLDGKRDRVVGVPVEAGTLVLFHGHHALHRVSPVSGEVTRAMALLSYAEHEGQVFNRTRLHGESVYGP